jgi:signal transduction histidine kinase
MCEILVRDNGIGFDEKQVDKIFAPFQRLNGRQAYEGTGMGLAICRRIVALLGGTISATSEPGVGATFVIALPQTAVVGDTFEPVA